MGAGPLSFAGARRLPLAHGTPVAGNALPRCCVAGRARPAGRARQGGAGCQRARARQHGTIGVCACTTCWLADGVSPAGLSRRGHLRPAKGTWLGEFRPTERGQAGRRERGAGRGSSCPDHPGRRVRVSEIGEVVCAQLGRCRCPGHCHRMAFIPGLRGSRRVAFHLGVFPWANAQWFLACCLSWVPDSQALVPYPSWSRLRVRTVSLARLKPGATC